MQEIELEKANKSGAYKELKSSETTMTFRRKTTTYHISYSKERFERPIKKAYKFSIHKSYRENGKVKKKQRSLFVIGYYNILDNGPYDYINSDYAEDIAKELGITEEEFWNMVYKKFDQLREKIENEFQQTEEFKTSQEHERITTIHFAKKAAFEEKCGKYTYDYCYDVFGVLRNEEYLKRVELGYNQQQEYYSSYQESKFSNYNEEEKKIF